MWRIDSTLDALGDLANAYSKIVWGNHDEETKKAELEKF
jgi:hypothetical protein